MKMGISDWRRAIIVKEGWGRICNQARSANFILISGKSEHS